MMKPYKSFDEVKVNDSSVHRIIRAGGSLEQVVTALANEKRELIDKLSELESCAPRRIRLASGETRVWQCPSDLIPESRTQRV